MKIKLATCLRKASSAILVLSGILSCASCEMKTGSDMSQAQKSKLELSESEALKQLNGYEGLSYLVHATYTFDARTPGFVEKMQRLAKLMEIEITPPNAIMTYFSDSPKKTIHLRNNGTCEVQCYSVIRRPSKVTEVLVDSVSRTARVSFVREVAPYEPAGIIAFFEKEDLHPQKSEYDSRPDSGIATSKMYDSGWRLEEVSGVRLVQPRR